MTTTMCAHEDRNIQCIWCTYKISTTIHYYHTEIWFVLSLSLSFFLFDFFLFRLTSTKMHTKKQCARISMTELIYSLTHSLKSVCRPHPIRIVQEKKGTSTEMGKKRCNEVHQTYIYDSIARGGGNDNGSDQYHI